MSRKTDIRTIQVVALVLENHQGEVLIQQRKKGTHLAGLWEFPGGKVEPNETHLEALNREIQEELNYTPVNPHHLITVSHQYPEKSIELFVFHQTDFQPSITNAENQPLQWILKSELSNMQMPDADLPIITLLNKQ